MTPGEALADVWARVGGDPAALAQVRLTGDDPVLPGVHRVGTAAAATIAAAAPRTSVGRLPASRASAPAAAIATGGSIAIQ
jgi:hypothetical protein